jgi:hypothetical protein
LFCKVDDGVGASVKPSCLKIFLYVLRIKSVFSEPVCLDAAIITLKSKKYPWTRAMDYFQNKGRKSESSQGAVLNHLNVD